MGRQQRKRRRLHDRGDADKALARFPPSDTDLMPTSLGNVLRSAHRHSWVRYRLDSVVSWPRLFACLPERTVTQLAGEKSQLDLVVVLSLLAGLYAPLAAGGAAVEARWWDAATFLVVGAVLCRLFYLVALPAAGVLRACHPRCL